MADKFEVDPNALAAAIRSKSGDDRRRLEDFQRFWNGLKALYKQGKLPIEDMTELNMEMQYIQSRFAEYKIIKKLKSL